MPLAYGYHVAIPTLDQRLAELKASLTGGAKIDSATKTNLLRELDLLTSLSMHPPPLPPRPPLSSGTQRGGKQPLKSSVPKELSMKAWDEAQAHWKVLRDSPAFEEPNLQAKKLEVLKKGRCVAVVLETKYWVKLRRRQAVGCNSRSSGGWVLKTRWGGNEKAQLEAVPAAPIDHFEFPPAATIVVHAFSTTYFIVYLSSILPESLLLGDFCHFDPPGLCTSFECFSACSPKLGGPPRSPLYQTCQWVPIDGPRESHCCKLWPSSDGRTSGLDGAAPSGLGEARRPGEWAPPLRLD
mmetsp:Transcript_19056/g.43166  ORF Transcript_19056/g.43166 Transcript_19056/m.43166 type:complete len:296 (-) Transcript_19056:233-1120(-)